MNRETSTETSKIASHPPKVSLILRLGIVGHRPNRLTNSDPVLLANQIQLVIESIQNELKAIYATDQSDLKLYDDTAPVLRVLSPLAEGVDRTFAERALAAGCELTAVLPFAQAEFEKDFEPGKSLEEDSLTRFRQLLGRATTVFQLDGSRMEESRTYNCAGRAVLNQSDLLIVVWDGHRKELRGGTEETFDDAIQHQVPVVWIDAHAPHHWRLVTKPIRDFEDIELERRAVLRNSTALEELRDRVRKLSLLPSPPLGLTQSDHQSHASLIEDPRLAIHRFYAEKQELGTTHPISRLSTGLWRCFRDAVGDFRLHFPKSPSVSFEAAVQREWPRNRENPIASAIDDLRPYYAWPDKLATHYANRYRSAFLTVFVAAACAVGAALVPFGFGMLTRSHNQFGQSVFVVAELVAIVGMIVLVQRGRQGQWHRRWLDYRLLAETIRHQRLIAHLGGERAIPSIPEHWSGYGSLGATWMAWYARTVERSLGLPHTIVDKDYLQLCLEHLKEQLDGPRGQIAFHKMTSSRSERIDSRLHKCESGLLWVTVICCVAHLAHIFWGHQSSQDAHQHLSFISGNLLTFFCGFFPAVSAALAGIKNQGEFHRIHLRSKSMSERLEQQLERVISLQERLKRPGSADKQLSVEIDSLAGEIARTMVSEVLDWRVIFHDRPLKMA